MSFLYAKCFQKRKTALYEYYKHPNYAMGDNGNAEGFVKGIEKGMCVGGDVDVLSRYLGEGVCMW